MRAEADVWKDSHLGLCVIHVSSRLLFPQVVTFVQSVNLLFCLS